MGLQDGIYLNGYILGGSRDSGASVLACADQAAMMQLPKAITCREQVHRTSQLAEESWSDGEKRGVCPPVSLVAG